jgi:hypothetical protein
MDFKREPTSATCDVHDQRWTNGRSSRSSLVGQPNGTRIAPGDRDRPIPVPHFNYGSFPWRSNRCLLLVTQPAPQQGLEMSAPSGNELAVLQIFKGGQDSSASTGAPSAPRHPRGMIRFGLARSGAGVVRPTGRLAQVPPAALLQDCAQCPPRLLPTYPPTYLPTYLSTYLPTAGSRGSATRCSAC